MNEANDSKFVTRKWNIVNDNSKANYKQGNKITYNTEILKSNICDYNGAYIIEDAYANNIIFTIKDTKLDVPVVTLSARDNQKLSKLLSKVFERSVYWNEYKTKSENKNTTNVFSNQTLVESIYYLF